MNEQENANRDELGQQLYCAAFDGDINRINALLASGVDVNYQYQGAWTPLHNAIEGYQVDAIIYLLKRGADINRSDSYGLTPLHLAVDVEAITANHEHEINNNPIPIPVDLTTLLLEHGADANARDSRGESPLDVALFYHHDAAEKLLRMYGAVGAKHSD